jgi:hypothetical protein
MNANSAYLTLLDVGPKNARLVDSDAELGAGFGIPRMLAKGATAITPIGKGLDIAKGLGKVLSWSPAKAESDKFKKQEELKKNTVVDPIATARMLAAANAAKDRISRQQGGPKYYEDAAKKLITNIQAQAVAQGRNPLIDAVLRDLITKKAITGG